MLAVIAAVLGADLIRMLRMIRPVICQSFLAIYRIVSAVGFSTPKRVVSVADTTLTIDTVAVGGPMESFLSKDLLTIYGVIDTHRTKSLLSVNSVLLTQPRFSGFAFRAISLQLCSTSTL